MKRNRKNIILECIESSIKKKSRYHTTKNIKKNKDKLLIKKYNYIIRKRTLHKEI